jgi:predicted nicotinamide N-methyase
VLDLGAGSGLLAIAAARSGASPVVAADIDAFSESAIALNAAANAVHVKCVTADLLDTALVPAPRFDVILVGDLFYEQTTAARVLAFLDRQLAIGVRVLIGDPGRSYLPRQRLERLADYSVPVTRDLEDQEIKRTAVFALVAA